MAAQLESCVTPVPCAEQFVKTSWSKAVGTLRKSEQRPKDSLKPAATSGTSFAAARVISPDRRRSLSTEPTARQATQGPPQLSGGAKAPLLRKHQTRRAAFNRTAGRLSQHDMWRSLIPLWPQVCLYNQSGSPFAAATRASLALMKNLFLREVGLIGSKLICNGLSRNYSGYQS